MLHLSPVECTWLHGFTSHLKVQTCTRQGTVVAGLTAAWQFTSGTTFSLPWMNWTQETVLWATPKSQDTEQGDVLNTFHLDKWQWYSNHYAFANIKFWHVHVCVCCTLLGSCGCYMKPLLWVWESHCTLNPPPHPPPPLSLQRSTTLCWLLLLHMLHCRLLA